MSTFILGPPHPDTLRWMRKQHPEWFVWWVPCSTSSRSGVAATAEELWDWGWSQLSPDEMRTLVEASTVDPEDHDYSGDGTSRCRVCLDSMNAHISWEKP